MASTALGDRSPSDTSLEKVEMRSTPPASPRNMIPSVTVISHFIPVTGYEVLVFTNWYRSEQPRGEIPIGIGHRPIGTGEREAIRCDRRIQSPL